MYLGIDLGGTGIKIGMVDETGKIVYSSSCPTRANEGYKAIAEDMAKLIEETLKETNKEVTDIKSIGIGVPGCVDNAKGEVIYTANIDMLHAPLAVELKKYYDLPVYLANDADCAALGEYFALNDENVKNLIAITLGTGVGGGIIIDGKIFAGSNSVAGELGHMVIKSGGEKCGCGRCGCWEAYASATAIIRETKRAIKENPDSLLAKNAKEEGEVNGKTAFDAAWAGCEVAKKVVDEYFTAIAEGLTNIVNIFQPQAIVIGGGVSRQGDKLLNPIKEHVYKYCYGSGLVDVAKISIAQLGNDAGIVGAAFLGK